MSKFHLHCSCIVCKLPIIVQNLNIHSKSHEEKPIKPPKSYCKNCGEPTMNDRFCSRSCSATYTNARKDYTKIKTGLKKGTNKKIMIEKPCVFCGKLYSGKRITCSDPCKKKITTMKLKAAARRRIDAGWNPQEHRCRSKPSFLEKSFEEWLNKIHYTAYVKNKTFRCGKKIYFGDFFFPDKNILIELDGKQHLNNLEYDNQRDEDILLNHGVKTIRISYTEFVNKTKVDLILNLLS